MLEHGDAPRSDEERSIHLHLGAHKTATTRLQSIFEANRGCLAKAGVHYDGPGELRGNRWLAPFRTFAGLGERPSSERGRIRLRAKQPPTPRWLFSEENLIGGPRGLMQRRGLYPATEALLRAFRRLFPLSEVRIFFAVRSYDSFLRSCYLEIVRNNEYFAWDDFHREVALDGLSWTSVIRQMAHCVSSEKICLWRHEDHSALEPEFLTLMTGLDSRTNLDLREVKGLTRPSMSTQALSALAKNRPAASRAEHRRTVERLIAQYPASGESDAFNPWTTAEQRSWRERYAQDLEAIQAQFPNLHFLKPDPATPS